MTGKEAFLDRAGWSDAALTPLASDASDRSYDRLHRPDGASAVLMSAPVTTSAVAARQFAEFRRMAAWLRDQHLAAPNEIAAEPDAGLLLMEDLGKHSLSTLLDRGAPDAPDAYGVAVSVLSRIAEAPVPDWLDQPDVQAIADMVGLTFALLPGCDTLAEELRGGLAEELAGLHGAPVVSLRDVHGDNLIWRSAEKGPRRVGLLDFQDAVALPDGYDLASLVDDPRRVVPLDWRDALVGDYAAARGLSHDAMAYRVELLSLQRNMRILGIFRRLATTQARPAYARFLPRTRMLIWRAVGHPGLHRLRPAVRSLLDRTATWEAEAA